MPARSVTVEGSDAGVQAPFYHKHGRVVALRIAGKTVTRTGEVEVGGVPEAVAFSPDGKYLYVGNFYERELAILRVEGATVTDTGTRLSLPGRPVSMRGRVP